MKAVILARVAKSTQDFERQVSELRNVTTSRAYEVIEEIVSKHTGDTKNDNLPTFKDF